MLIWLIEIQSSSMCESCERDSSTKNRTDEVSALRNSSSYYFGVSLHPFLVLAVDTDS